MERGETLKTPLLQVFRANFVELILGTFIMVATYGLFYIMTTWILSYAIGKVDLGCLAIGYRDFLVLQLISVVMFAAFIPIAGYFADHFGRRAFLLVITAAIVLYGMSFGKFLTPETMGSGEHANQVLMLAFLSLGMALMGLSFGPMSALLPELFPTNTRYTGSGVAYNMASILGAALTPFVATWLAENHGPGSVGVYLALLGMVSMVALFVSQETKFTNLDTMRNESATGDIDSTSP
jgi:MFS family permease